MAAVNDFISVGIAVSSASPAVPGFGKSLVMLNKVPAGFTAPRTYSDPSGPISDGFLTTDPGYLAIEAAFAADPRPSSVMVAKRANKTAQVVTFTVLNANAGTTYGFTWTNPSGAAVAVTNTPTGTPTPTTIAAALAAAFAGGGVATAVASGPVVTVTTTTAGQLNGYSAWGTNLYFADVSADPGIAADLAATILLDNTWYGLDIDSHSKAEILATAAWAEANKKLFVTSSADSNVPDNTVTTDVGSSIMAAAYNYTGLLYSGQNTLSFAGLAWQSHRFAATPTPGNDTWMFNTLNGITVDPLTETQNATLASKNVTGYQVVGGRNMTASGGIANAKSAGMVGSGQFIDIRRFLDWQLSEIQLALFSVVSGARKVPFTDKGMVTLVNAETGALNEGVASGGWVAGSIEVLQPLVANASPSDKAARIVRNLNFSADLAGGVHLVVSSGTVSL